MNIYKIYNPNRTYKTISYSDTPILNNIGGIIWDNPTEISSFSYNWENNEEPENICDCPFIIGSIPVFNEKTFRILINKLHKDYIQVIPINVDGEPYYIINTIHMIPDILNKRKSEISYFSDGRIMDIDKYVFHKKNNIPSIFKIPELCIYTFINEEIASIITDSNTTGIELEKCKISSSILPF